MAPSRNTPSLAHDPGTRQSESVIRILEEAETLFAELGFEAVSINAIAERAGISKANVFHHFASKRDLYLAVLHRACERCADHMQSLEVHDGTFPERMRAYSADMLTDMLDKASLHRLMLRELLGEEDGRVAKELAERVFGDKFARLVSILRTGQARADLRSDFDPGMAAMVLIGMNLFFLQSRNVFGHLPDARVAADPKRYSAMLTDILLRGIAVSPASPESE